MAAQGVAGSLMDRPMSVEEITQKADGFFDTSYPMQNWFRTANLMLKQANVYEHEGNDQMAYFLLYRYARLFLTDIASHPNAKDSEYKLQLADARKTLPKTLGKLEVLKPRIEAKHDRYMDKQKRRQAQAEAEQREYQKREYDASEEPRRAEKRVWWEPRRIDAAQNKDMAVQLANLENQQGAQRELRSAGGFGQERDLSAELINVRRQMDRPQQRSQDPAKPRAALPARSSSYQYPKIPSTSKEQPQPQLHHPQPQPPLPSNGLIHYNGAPTIPPKERESENAAPPLPSKPFIPLSAHPRQRYQPTPSPSPPTVPGKERYTPSPSLSPPSTATSSPVPFATPSHLESGAPLRTIFLPSPLRHSFLRLAARNTAQNLETCGILAGLLLRNAFFISKLIIPAQTATSDTCEMVDEAALHTYIDSFSTNADGSPSSSPLLVLGWIHTHPSQTCFMSSRDLHTHVWYQVSLPESIAIVCAPSRAPPDDWGVFRLTDPPGVGVVKTCKRSGIFHPHEEGSIYTDCVGRPGHVIEHEDLMFEVVDLRK